MDRRENKEGAAKLTFCYTPIVGVTPAGSIYVRLLFLSSIIVTLQSKSFTTCIYSTVCLTMSLWRHGMGRCGEIALEALAPAYSLPCRPSLSSSFRGIKTYSFLRRCHPSVTAMRSFMIIPYIGIIRYRLIQFLVRFVYVIIGQLAF